MPLTKICSMMSLRLDETEASLDMLVSSLRSRKTVEFYYPTDLVSLHSRIFKLKFQAATGSFGMNTRNRMGTILARWESEIVSKIAMPSDISSVSEVILWTLDRVDISSSAFHTVDSITIHSLSNGSRLRIIHQGSSVDVYLDKFHLHADVPRQDSPSQSLMTLPLRFALACIYPLVMGGTPPAFDSLTVDVVSQVARFMPIDEMPQLALVNCLACRACDSDFLWKHIYDNLQAYTNSQSSCPTGPVGGYKAAVKLILLENQRKRMSRFSKSVQMSDWATPSYIFESVSRPRRIVPIDYLDLS